MVNMPVLIGLDPVKWWESYALKGAVFATHRPLSLVSLYRAWVNESPSTRVPTTPHMCELRYFLQLGESTSDEKPAPDELVVHFRGGDKTADWDHFLSALTGALQASSANRVAVLASSHHSTDSDSDLKEQALLHHQVGLVLEWLAIRKVKAIHRSPKQGADADLRYMARAQHLLVSVGGFSALAAYLCEGDIYYAPPYDALSNYSGRGGGGVLHLV
jgi:hypothetical protein